MHDGLCAVLFAIAFLCTFEKRAEAVEVAPDIYVLGRCAGGGGDFVVSLPTPFATPFGEPCANAVALASDTSGRIAPPKPIKAIFSQRGAEL